MKLGKLVLVILAALWLQPARADNQLTAGELYDFCSSSDLAVNNACRYYILGVVQSIGLGVGSTKDQQHLCIPDNVPGSQLVTIFQRTAQADFARFPQDKAEPAIALVGAAILAHFHCAARN